MSISELFEGSVQLTNESARLDNSDKVNPYDIQVTSVIDQLSENCLSVEKEPDPKQVENINSFLRFSEETSIGLLHNLFQYGPVDHTTIISSRESGETETFLQRIRSTAQSSVTQIFEQEKKDPAYKHNQALVEDFKNEFKRVLISQEATLIFGGNKSHSQPKMAERPDPFQLDGEPEKVVCFPSIPLLDPDELSDQQESLENEDTESGDIISMFQDEPVNSEEELEAKNIFCGSSPEVIGFPDLTFNDQEEECEGEEIPKKPVSKKSKKKCEQFESNINILCSALTSPYEFHKTVIEDPTILGHADFDPNTLGLAVAIGHSLNSVRDQIAVLTEQVVGIQNDLRSFKKEITSEVAHQIKNIEFPSWIVGAISKQTQSLHEIQNSIKKSLDKTQQPISILRRVEEPAREIELTKHDKPKVQQKDFSKMAMVDRLKALRSGQGKDPLKEKIEVQKPEIKEKASKKVEIRTPSNFQSEGDNLSSVQIPRPQGLDKALSLNPKDSKVDNQLTISWAPVEKVGDYKSKLKLVNKSQVDAARKVLDENKKNNVPWGRMKAVWREFIMKFSERFEWPEAIMFSNTSSYLQCYEVLDFFDFHRCY